MPLSKTAVDIYNADGNEILIKSGQMDRGVAQSGSLATQSFSTTVGASISTTSDVFANIAVTNTSIAGTCAIALSPDNSTYSTVQTLTSGVNSSVLSTGVLVPAGWFMKLTFTNATCVVTLV